MGVVMGHELSHAFDDQGREFDENGNMREWWTNNTSEEFKKLTQCIATQYSDFTMTVKGGKQNIVFLANARLLLLINFILII